MKTKQTQKTKTVADYVKLAKRGFSNKQIAIFLKRPLTSISAFQSNATRQGLL